MWQNLLPRHVILPAFIQGQHSIVVWLQAAHLSLSMGCAGISTHNADMQTALLSAVKCDYSLL